MWSYSGNPNSSAKDATRFLIGDTDSCDQLLQDGEIEYFLAQYNNAPINAGIRCIETIMSKFSRKADESVGQVRISFSQQAKAYRTMLNDLRTRLASEDIVPYAGGISKSDYYSNYQNRGNIPPDFSKQMMENTLISPWVTGNYGTGNAWPAGYW